ncbi:amidohydrolase [Lacinutrix sp. Bg11-31]|uniref:amidohydrolase n=1 Tax=Lacinutrix sp. Bg11-31 TaxID=2057808 RepID=UPI000C300071|nr:amidohydrolase [Lacinutrix sp. Bg11-31]AUC82745.1 amidohydrolase [Lacinutrix sp. Bg11-31]
MNENFKIAIVQSNLVWENAVQNRINFQTKIDAIVEYVDLIVLPEMFTSGFNMNAKAIAETMKGETVAWMQDLANQKRTAIVGSIAVLENDKYYNRLLFVKPNGEILQYNKRHSFSLAGEDKVFTAGAKKVIIEYNGWSICPQVCYDLRFPVWARNTEDYDVLLYVANWPKQRIAAWDALLKARAIENMSYCVGVNRVGLDGNSYEYPGHSAVYDVLGKKLTTENSNKEVTEIVTLNKSHIEKNRRHLGFLNDKDSFNLTI